MIPLNEHHFGGTPRKSLETQRTRTCAQVKHARPDHPVAQHSEESLAHAPGRRPHTCAAWHRKPPPSGLPTDDPDTTHRHITFAFDSTLQGP
jgi:hypothetical protein